MTEQLRALVQLAEIDSSARELEDKLRGIPEELDERKKAVEALEALVGGQKAQLEEAERLLNQQDEELKDRSGMLAKSKSKSAKARNMREAQAAEREIESIRRSMRDAEAEKERLTGVLEQTRKVLEEPLKELEEQKKALEEAIAGSEAKLTELRAELEKATEGRQKWAGQIDKQVVRRYDRLRVKINPMVVEAQDGTCIGCRMRLPPQLYNQIQRADDFHQCPQCHRFLYFKEAIL